MKAITRKLLDSKMIGRAIIDRKRTVTSAVLLETRVIDKEFNTPLTPSALYSYYISICQISNYDLMADDKIAKQLGVTPRAVADNRRKLTKAGWIRFDKFTHKGRDYGTWYIGKGVVATNLATATTKDLYNLGIITEDEYIATVVLEEELKSESL